MKTFILNMWGTIWKWFKEFIFSWWELIKTIGVRFFEGLKNRNFLIYFITIVVFVGGFGVLPGLNKILNSCSPTDELYLSFSKALSTYFIAIIATSAADLILNKEPTETEARILRMPAIMALVAGGFLIFLIQMELTKSSFELSVIGTILAWFLWWITNSIDGKYQDNENNESGAMNPIGGEVNSGNNGENNSSVIPGVEM
ncbi:MAG: hypothetical protein P1U44_10920 [Vicingaceae bacterium]|nr:hypothetical protein [Vicingaceae bacterium]